MKKIEIDSRFKGGFSLFEGYKTVELVPEPANNRDNLLWLWCYDANMMSLDFANCPKTTQNKIVTTLCNRNSLKSVPIDVVIDGLLVIKAGRIIKPHKYEEEEKMKLTPDEQVLYDFFVTFGKVRNSIDYPIVVLAVWTTDEGNDDGILYPEKQAVIDAYCKPGVMDKPLYEAIKTIKGWK